MDSSQLTPSPFINTNWVFSDMVKKFSMNEKFAVKLNPKTDKHYHRKTDVVRDVLGIYMKLR